LCLEKAKPLNRFFNKRSTDLDEDVDQDKPKTLSFDKGENKKPKTKSLDFVHTLAVMEGLIMCDSLSMYTLLKSCQPKKFGPVFG
jgi:hypothetical protein